MRCLYLYNPVSGKRIAEKKKDYIVKKLIERFGEVDVYATRGQGELAAKAGEACGVYDVLVFAGGDGSFNEVVTGLGERENRPVLGYIPTGTVNDVARSVGIPLGLRGAVKNITEGGAYSLDVMRVNDGYAMYVACSGGLTACSYTAKQSEKNKLGKIAYAVEAIKKDLIFEEYEVNFDAEGKTQKSTAVMIMIMNGRSVAGMPVNSGGYVDDGKAEVIIVHEKPKKRELESSRHLRYLTSALKVFTRGFKRLTKSRKMSTYSLSEFAIDVSDDIIWNFDGERGFGGKLNVKVLNKHISLIIPRPAKRRSCLCDGKNSKEVLF